MRALALALLAACGAPPTLPSVPEAGPWERGVVVTTTCVTARGVSVGRGNGVVTGPHEVATAAHVVGRHPGTWCPDPSVDVAIGGEHLEPDALNADPDRDVAFLHFPGVTGYAPAPLGPSGQGAACAFLHFPDPGVACGWIGPDAEGAPGTDIELDFGVIAGNSGAGIWRDDRLVGLVTARDTRDPDRGWGTSILPKGAR